MIKYNNKTKFETIKYVLKLKKYRNKIKFFINEIIHVSN